MEPIRSYPDHSSPDLTLFICETFQNEITRVIAEIPTQRIQVCLFPHHCSAGLYHLENISRFLRDHSNPEHQSLLFGDTQLIKQGLLPPGITHAGPDTCNALVAPEEFIAHIIQGGAHIILPGWLLSWERYVREMGFNPKNKTSFYSSSVNEIIVLDTGVIRIPEEKIRSFEWFSGLPVRTIPVGTSHLSGIIHSAVYQWETDRVRSSCNQEVSAALESNARQMAVINMISDIARVSKEEDVISRIFMMCQLLFAPRSVRYLPVQPEGPGTMISIPPNSKDESHNAVLLSILGKDFEIFPDQSGFGVPIIYMQETLGILGVYEVSIPERVREYLNLTLSFTKLLGLAISNARSWHNLTTIKERLEAVNLKLQEKNEELLTISQELQSANRELIKSQKELTESELFIKGIVNSAHVGIAVMDPEFHILFWNPEMERIIGLLSDDIKGKNFLEVFPLIITYKRDHFLVQALTGEIVQAPDFFYPPGPSGKPIWISSIYSPVYDHNQNIIGIVLNIYDITHRKESEQDLERAYDAIRIAQEKLNILSSITRHDILNRVMVITAYSEMLIETETDEKSRIRLQNMLTAGSDIQHLIEFTRQYQELGVKKPTWQKIENIMQRISLQSVLAGVDITITGTSAMIYADPMLEKVIYNLVENSKRHGEHVSAITITTEQQGDNLIIAYSDNGVGVPSEEKKLIFKKGHGKNTGMGLFLIREILGLTKISIRECGLPGVGARFEMIVPHDGWRKVTEESSQSP
ncbi:MAG: PAS domain S-box protein [Methanospirillum sp.]|uniref:PAS domain S-box protein n=1 Tax=Methanospirillum sp. TaxID=45200 RepID=UPI002372D17C|nr:PAS domain S-box protein [Methanospirillum sp.]MDD1727781.1 PAS domain S-box protein [Methanospirillum sp.]